VEEAKGELEERLAEVKEEKKELSADLEKSNKWLSVSLKEVQALKEQDKRNAEEAKELRGSVQEARNKAKEKEAALRKLEDEHTKLGDKFKGQKEQLAKLEGQAKQIQTQLAASDAKMKVCLHFHHLSFWVGGSVFIIQRWLLCSVSGRHHRCVI
jgi:chromosome segregation ATPase